MSIFFVRAKLGEIESTNEIQPALFTQKMFPSSDGVLLNGQGLSVNSHLISKRHYVCKVGPARSLIIRYQKFSVVSRSLRRT